MLVPNVCDLPKGEFVCEAQLHRGTALRAKLLQHDPEPCDALRGIEFAIERRPRPE
jgi:hypothetical protein